MSTSNYFWFKNKLKGEDFALGIDVNSPEKHLTVYQYHKLDHQQWTKNDQGVIQSKFKNLVITPNKLPYHGATADPPTGTLAQQWSFTSQRQLQNKEKNLVLEVKEAPQGMYLTLAEPKDNSPAQQWEIVLIEEVLPVYPPPVTPPQGKLQPSPVSELDYLISFFAEKSLEISKYYSSGLRMVPQSSTHPNTRQIKFKKGSEQGYIHLSFNHGGYFAEIDLFSQDNEVEIIPGRYLRWPLSAYTISESSFSQNLPSYADAVSAFNSEVIICIAKIFAASFDRKGEIFYNVGEDILTLRSPQNSIPTTITMKVSSQMKAFLINFINRR